MTATTGTALVPVAPTPPPAAVALGTLQASDARELVASATALAQPLADIIARQKLFVELRGRRHVRVEGWTTLAAMLGIVASEVEVLEHEGVYVAIVELRRMADGRPVTRASAECGRPDELDKNGEPMWASRPAYARRSMALTRATGKACRLAFSWVMTLAGYDPTPAEEMEGLHVELDEPPASPPPRPRPRPEPWAVPAKTFAEGANFADPTPAGSAPAAPVPSAATAPVPPTRVVSVKPWTSQSGERVFFIKLADGTEASTKDQEVADQAMQAERSKTPVWPDLKAGKAGKWFLNGLTVARG